MKPADPSAPHFPTLGARAEAADLQVRQTLALGLLPLGIAFFLMAWMSPHPPSAGLWAGVVLTLFLMAAQYLLWHRARRRDFAAYSTLHFLIRYALLILCPWMVWAAFQSLILATSGILPPLLIGGLFFLYPIDRLIRERIAARPQQPPRLAFAHQLCVHSQVVLGVLAFGGIFTGAIIDAQEDYPTDPTMLLLFIWLVILLVLLATFLSLTARWQQLYTRDTPPQTLDDPARPPPANPIRFGSDQF